MFHKRLEELRLKSHLTKRDVANIFHVAESTYGKWELGKRKPDLKTIAALAEYYKVSTDYLLGNTDDPTPPEQRKATLEEVESGIKEVWESVGFFDPNISDAKRELIIKITKSILESDM